jgi:hypothetical protein
MPIIRLAVLARALNPRRTITSAGSVPLLLTAQHRVHDL